MPGVPNGEALLAVLAKEGLKLLYDPIRFGVDTQLRLVA
jgi:hypothetical protein